MTMLGKLFMYLSAVLGTLLVVSGIAIWFYRAEIKELTRDYLASTVNVETCLLSLEQQNVKYRALQIDYETRKAEVKIITKIEVVERLKVVYREHNLTKEQCDETASVIDSIRTHGF